MEEKFGEKKKFKVICSTCGKEIIVEEREKIFPKKDKYYCNRSCSNSVGGNAKVEKYGII